MSIKKSFISTKLNNISNIMVKGYIFTGLMLIAIIFTAAAMLTMAAVEKAANKRKIERIRAQYLAESMIDICKSRIIDRLANMDQLLVFYEHPDDYPDSNIEILLTDSLPVYLGDSELDFGDICAETMSLISGENVDMGAFYCEIFIIDKSPSELKLHTLDKNGDLKLMDYDSIGELLPLEYVITVTFRETSLESLFTISGVEFILIDNKLLSDGHSGIMTIGLSTKHTKLKTEHYFYMRKQ